MESEQKKTELKPEVNEAEEEEKAEEKEEDEEVEPWTIDTTPWEDADIEVACACNSEHEDDYYPEQCPICYTWYIGQCATDNLLYDPETLEPYSCFTCDSMKDEET